MKNKKFLLGATGLLAAGLAVTFAPKATTLFNASATTKLMHYAAVMPTAASEGIREYWTYCDGSAPMFENPGQTATEGVLTNDQIASIKSNLADERIIPTLTKIQAGVTAAAKGLNAYEYSNVYNAYAYNYLDATTKATITGDVTGINSAKQAWDANFMVVWDAGKDALPGYDQANLVTGFERAFDAKYGDVMAINTAEIQGKSFEFYFYGFGSRTYSADATVSYSVKSPFPAADKTSQTTWCGLHATAAKFTLTPSGWTDVASNGADLNSDGNYATSMGGAITIQRYVSSSATIDPYQGTYYFSSIFATKPKTYEEGGVILSSSQTITDMKTWGVSEFTLTQDVDTEYGPAAKIDFSNKTTVFEATWAGLNTADLAHYKYAVLHVFAPKNTTFYLSQAKWRNDVLNVGVDPADVDGNKAAAEAYDSQRRAGWLTFVMPTSYFHKSTLFFEIWNQNAGVENGWLISSIYGYNDLDSDGTMSLISNYSSDYTSESVIERVEGKNSFKITCNSTTTADRFNLGMPRLDLTGYTSIKFEVKAPCDGLFALYHDKYPSSWWPIGDQVTPSVNAEGFTTIEYKAEDVNEGFSWSDNRYGLLCIAKAGKSPVGVWYINISFVK